MFEWDALDSRWVAKSSDDQARNNFILQAWEVMWKDKMNVQRATQKVDFKPYLLA